jgi:hypothetical protein
MIITWAPMVGNFECENTYVEEIIKNLDLDDSFHIIIGRINTQQETEQLKQCIIQNKKNILIMKSDEMGIIPPFINDLFMVFRMYNNNSLVDYNKIFPIPCGYSMIHNNNGVIHTYQYVEPKNINERSYDLFFSGQMSHNRNEMISVINNIKEKYNSLINVTDGFAKGFNINDFYDKLGDSKIALVPNGAVIPESFRFFESFMRHCIVITTLPQNSMYDMWYYKDCPALFLNNWHELTESKIDDLLNNLDYHYEKSKSYFENKLSAKAVAKYIKETIENGIN